MKDLASRFSHNWKARRFPTQGQILLALSGGIDSMALAHLLKANGIPFAAAHCNFSLRGVDADEDTRFVESWCRQQGITCHVARFDTKKIAAERKQSIQLAARELRYEWFEALRRE